MGRIIADICKDKYLPQRLCWPVQYSPIAQGFQDRCAEDLTLQTYFAGDWLLFLHPPLVELEYDPSFRGLWRPLRATGRPLPPTWADERDNRYVIRALVNPVEKKTLAEKGVTKKQLREVLVAQVQRLTPKKLPCDRWTFSLKLGREQGSLECVAQNGSGIRPRGPIRVLVSSAGDPLAEGDK